MTSCQSWSIKVLCRVVARTPSLLEVLLLCWGQVETERVLASLGPFWKMSCVVVRTPGLSLNGICCSARRWREAVAHVALFLGVC